MRYVLDTHVLVWWIAAPSRLTSAERRVLARSSAQPVLVADITLWEIAMLVELWRLEIGRPLREWLEEATAAPHVELARLTPAIAAEVAALPDSFHRDPADRILVATARVHGATLLTHDRAIAASGLAPVLR